MGDRANIIVDGEYTDPVFLYTHWRGYATPGILQAALSRGRGRWGDTSYLTRIIFCELIGKDTDGLTGFGISTRICDNNRPLLYLSDSSTGLVTLRREDRDAETQIGDAYGEGWTYEEFCNINLADAGHGEYEEDDEHDFLQRLALARPVT